MMRSLSSKEQKKPEVYILSCSKPEAVTLAENGGVDTHTTTVEETASVHS